MVTAQLGAGEDLASVATGRWEWGPCRCLGKNTSNRGISKDAEEGMARRVWKQQRPGCPDLSRRQSQRKSREGAHEASWPFIKMWALL